MDITQTLSEINKHIAVLNADSETLAKNYTQLSVDVAVLKTQMASMIWGVKTFAVAFIGIFVTQIWQLIILGKNNKK